MNILTVDASTKSYPIYIGEGLLGLSSLFQRIFPKPKKLIIVTNTIVAPLYLEKYKNVLSDLGHVVVSIILPDGEANKNWHTLNLIFDGLLENSAERSSVLVALGGGVVGDMTGFAAAVYQRGIPFVQIPTTLLAQVDSSVGGKTAINHPLGKNMIGSFYQPEAVVIDLSVLDTLPERELSAGLAEVIKYGLIADPEFFDWLEANMEGLRGKDKTLLAEAVHRSCENKARVVGIDEHEHGLRAILNLGHTFGHAIETALGYGVCLHGEAVGIGMMLAAQVSCSLGAFGLDDVERVRRLLERAGLATNAPELGFDRWIELMGHDKKVDAGRIRFVLLEKIGKAYVTADVPVEVLKAFLK